MADFGKENGDPTFVPRKQANEWLDSKGVGTMADHIQKRKDKTSNDNYREGHARTFKRTKDDISGKVFNGKEWVPKK